MADKKNQLITGNIQKAIIAFVLPVMAGSLIQQLYVTADAVIVGQFAGKSGLAAIDSVHTLFGFPLNFMNGLAAGAAILISAFFGANDRKELNSSVRTSITAAMVLGVILSIAGLILAPQLLTIMAVPDDIFYLTLTYTRIYFGGIWAMILYNMTAGIIRALGDSKRPLYVLILCSVINISGDLLLVGALKMGVGGAAIATVFAQAVSVVCNFVLLSREVCDSKPIYLPYFSRQHMRGIITKGLPLAIQSMMFPVANSIVQASINSMGINAIAAWGICDTKLAMIIWLIADSMSPAMTTFIAQNLGAGKIDRVRKGALIGGALSAGVIASISILLFFVSGLLGPLFVSAEDAKELIPIVVSYMRTLAPFYIFYALAEAYSGICCGFGDTVGPMIVSIITICLLRVFCIFVLLPSHHSMEFILRIYIMSWISAGFSFIGLAVFRMRKLKAA